MSIINLSKEVRMKEYNITGKVVLEIEDDILDGVVNQDVAYRAVLAAAKDEAAKKAAAEAEGNFGYYPKWSFTNAEHIRDFQPKYHNSRKQRENQEDDTADLPGYKETPMAERLITAKKRFQAVLAALEVLGEIETEAHYDFATRKVSGAIRFKGMDFSDDRIDKAIQKVMETV